MSKDRPSKLLGIRDDAVAVAFDYLVAFQMQKWRDEREQSKMEALAGIAPFSQEAMIESLN